MSETLALLDSETALGRIRGKTDLYRRLLEQAEPHRQAGQLLNAALAAGNVAEAGQIAHRLAGVAAALGGDRLAALARQVEAEARNGAVSDDLRDQFSSLLKDTFVAIDTWLGRGEKPVEQESWCLVRQTVQMLELAAGQIHVAMRDSSLSVEALIGAFSAMAERVQELEGRMQNALPPENDLGEGLRQVSGSMGEALVALQFYDRLAQRLEHVEHGLGHLAELLADSAQREQPTSWRALQEQIRSRYTTEEERIMFESVMGGMSVADAIAHYKENVLARTGCNGAAEVELF